MRTNPTHCTFAEFLDEVDPERRPICEGLRRTIIELHRHVVEIVWRRQHVASYGIGPKKLSQHYVYISLQTPHVRLGFYRGAFLNDSSGLLEGIGKNSRHVTIRSLADTDAPELKSLIRQAISERLASRA